MTLALKGSVAFGALLGALAVCMSLPSLDPGCGMSSAGPAQASCGLGPAWFPPGLASVEFILGAAIAVFVALSIVRQGVRHRRVAQGLQREARPALVADRLVGLVPGSGLVLVAGIRGPQIYCSADIVGRLEPDELNAVLLHERHHMLTHAPARLVLLSALAPVLGRLPSGQAWIERERAQIEIAADTHALDNGATRPALARAIFKLQAAPPTTSVAAFASANALRLRALLGEDKARARSTVRRLVAVAMVAATVGATICSALSLF